MASTVREELLIMELIEQIEKCKALVAFFKRSGLNGKLSRTLKQEMEVRWNSILVLLRSIDDVWDEIEPTLREFSDVSKMAGICRNTIKQLINFLTPFEEESVKLQGRDYSTCPLVVLSFSRLVKHCTVPLAPQDGTGTAEKPAFELLRRNAKDLLTEKVKIEMEHKVGTFFMPKFRKMLMISENSRNEVFAHVRSLITTLSKEMSNEDGPSPPKRSKLDNGYDDWFCDAEEFEVEEDEVNRYLRGNFDFQSATTENLLEWWKSEGVIFPQLQKLARKILCIPATSAESERTFSSTGFIIDVRVLVCHHPV